MDRIITKLYCYLQDNIPASRFSHCCSTAFCAEILAEHFGIEARPVVIAALCHDLARDLTAENLISLCRKSEYDIPEIFYRYPVLLHGPAAAWTVHSEFGINDSSILDSIFWHTCGHPLMDENAKIVYIADYIEPLREHISQAEKESVFRCNLNMALLSIMRIQRNYFKIHKINEITFFSQLINKLEEMNIDENC